ncbi:zinc finger protein Rlf [Osmerus eperlanus]|uniref:zinc finger protein Rlf n=1 Tax=Osmerus eperlanus TaxID=29151 RepID=UPI002E0F3C0B
MAESNVEPDPDWSNRPSDTAEDTLVAMESLLTTLRALEAELRQREISEISSTEYCDNFCQALMNYAGSRNSVEHGLPLLEVYCLSINCFAAARPHLTADSDNVALVLKRLALSCFELLLSVPENEIPYEAWVQFHHSVQMAHDALLEYGSTDLQALLQITGEGGAWSNPVLNALLTGQHTSTEEVDAYIALEGEGFMEMRVKHLEKMGEIAKAVVLAKACTECSHISNEVTFRQTYVSLLCHLLPNAEAIAEISRLNCKDVLEITCNLETEGEENTAFILCTTFLTQQLQQQNLYCSWELTLLWSKLQRRIDPSLESLLERCLQLGAIAKTVCHLLFLVRIIRTEAEQLGLASSVELCVKALQLPKQDEDSETRMSICKTVSSLLLDDLEVLRACQLTDFLLSPSQTAFSLLQELHLRPDQKYDQENGVIPNSLRCELLLALKAHWPFDPEFWDWNMLRHHCITLLGLDPEEDVDEGGQEGGSSGQEVKEEERGNPDHTRELCNGLNDSAVSQEEDQTDKKSQNKSEKGKCKKYKFTCKICDKSVTETRLLHHSKRHVNNNVYTCPICLETFSSRKDFIPHTKVHLRAPAKKKKKNKKKIDMEKLMDDDDDDDDSDGMEPGEIAVDPSLILYYQSTRDPVVLDHILEQAKTIKPVDEEHVTFNYINIHFELQNRDIYTCPGTHCTKTFKHSKYLGVHLKSEHIGDENVKHFFEMKNRRVKCSFCRRHFMSAYHYRKHRRVHATDQPFLCVVTGCNARFETSNELVSHKQSHGFQLSYQCELKGCSLTFSDLGQLYHHEAQHFCDAAYSCIKPDCNKYYLSKKEFIKHLATHSITLSEEEFEAQRKAKGKLLEPVTEEVASPKKSNDIKSEQEEMVNGDNVAPSSSTSSASTSKEPKGTVASVAVCFDGKRFTCGFERCGMSFTRARDVQRHLKAAHPEHLKSENKEHKKHDKEKGGSKTKSVNVKPEQSTEETGRSELSTSQQTKGTSQDNTSPSQVTHNASTLSSPNVSGDPLGEIMIGLSQLSLNPSSLKSWSCEPPRLTSVPTQLSLDQALMIKSPFVLLQKEVQPLLGERVKVTTKTEPSELPSGSDSRSPFLLQACTKPYTCEVKGCSFRSVTSYTLFRHYMSKHNIVKEKAKGMLKSLKFKPFVCHICSRSFREKSDLRTHYVRVHKLSDAVLEEMRYLFKRREEMKASENTAKVKTSLKQISESLKKDTLKMGKKEMPTWQQRYQKTKAGMLRRENGHDKSGDKNGKMSQTASSAPDTCVKEEEGEDIEERSNNERLVAKRNLCYILTKYNKSFHCKNKDCNATFTSQVGFLHHLEAVHRYNHSQLSLEKDLMRHKNSDVRKGKTRMQPSPPSDDPEPRFRCTFNNCNASYHLKSSLLRHTNRDHRDSHIQSSQLIHCKYDGCTSVFTHASNLNKHMLFTHCNFYDSVVVRLQSTHKKDKSVSGCQKKLIITSSKPKTDTPTLPPHRQSLRRNSKSKDDPDSRADTGEEEEPQDIKTPENNKKQFQKFDRFEDMDFRSHEEALQMCQDRCLRVAYPCMVQGCDSVVKIMSSMRRHYLTCHTMALTAFVTHQDKLMFTAEQLEELIQKKSALSSQPDGIRTPNGVLKMEYQSEPENPGGPSVPMSLHSIKMERLDDHDPLGFAEKNPAERNVLVGADDLLYGEPSGHTEDPATQNGHAQDVRSRQQAFNPPPPPADLSPTSTLRFSIDEGFLDTSGHKPTNNISGPMTATPARQPLKRKNELSEHFPSHKEPPPLCPTPRTFDLATYKPMGFESSFLKFIQETTQDEDIRVGGSAGVAAKRKDSHRRDCSVKENSQNGLTHPRNRRTRSAPLKPLTMKGDYTSVQNLRSILDKALTGCGDLAIKQLQYLRPVVVLERSKFSTSLLDIFPTDSNDQLLLGS